MQSIDSDTKEMLRQYIERVERLEEEKSNIMSDIKNVLLDAKANGFVPSIIRQVIKAKKMDSYKLSEQETLFEIYKKAVGLK